MAAGERESLLYKHRAVKRNESDICMSNIISGAQGSIFPNNLIYLTTFEIPFKKDHSKGRFLSHGNAHITGGGATSHTSGWSTW